MYSMQKTFMQALESLKQDVQKGCQSELQRRIFEDFRKG